MNSSGLKFFAALIVTVMVVVPFLGLDSLPKTVRTQIVAERSALTEAQNKLRTTQSEVTQNVQAEADLFRAIPSSQKWPEQFNQAATDLQSAGRDMEQLTALEKANRKQDRQRAEMLLAHERQLRTTAQSRANDIQKEATHWVDMKRRLPQVLQQMERDYQAIRGFDFAPLVAVVQKAEADYPEKRADLETRLSGVRDGLPQADSLWQSTAEARRQAAASDFRNLDFGTLFAAADKLRSSAADLTGKTSALQALTGQLYTAWDKLLVDMRTRNGQHDQQIRTVTTKDGKSTSDEKWVTVPRSAFESMKNNLGMAIEHKATGKFDSEAERTAQPAGFAYVAPPGERNQYGYWDNSGGQNFWVFYGQYALMRDLLFNRDYRPLDSRDYEGYRQDRSRGQTYYGRDEATAAPKYGTEGRATQERYSGSTYSKSGGFKDSQYASKSGGYRDSQYASPSSRRPDGDAAPRSFGSGSSRPDNSRAVPTPSRPSYRPSAPSSRPSSAPRRFGRR